LNKAIAKFAEKERQKKSGRLECFSSKEIKRLEQYLKGDR